MKVIRVERIDGKFIAGLKDNLYGKLHDANDLSTELNISRILP